MKSERLYNILEGFNFSHLNNPEFKEDSVREEIILPIIKGLGYSANKPNQIIRSRGLLHPFVSIGGARKNIYIIPDYLFEINSNPGWILDAKSPSEKITQSKHVEQAYSYAIHPEVRVKYYALCNGREFVLYNIEEIKPIVSFPLQAIPLYWDTLKKFLSPATIFSKNPLHLNKDLGLHLKRLGFESFERLIFPNVPITHIAQLDDNMFTMSGGVLLDDVTYVVSFDFNMDIMLQLKGKIPSRAFDLLMIRHEKGKSNVSFGEEIHYVDLDCKIGTQLEENEKEIFLPMNINAVV